MRGYITELEEMKKHVDVQLMINRQRQELLQKQSEVLKETIGILKSLEPTKAEEKLVKCRWCGMEAVESDNFCSYCGKRLKISISDEQKEIFQRLCP